MEAIRFEQLSTLSHPQRMEVFRLLMRRYPDALPAGEITDVLGLKASTASVYLSALREAGLITQTRSGRSLLYRANIAALRGLVGFLFNDCCRGRPDLCPPEALASLQGGPAMSDGKYNVLFICTGNSARSIIAETLLRHLAGDRFNAFSAGTRPYSELNPIAVATLHDKGFDTAGLRAKNISEFQGPDAPKLDFVFTVCDRAANEECPAWAGQPISAHWGLPDPAKAMGSDAERALAFQQAFGILQNRLHGFAALPMDSLDRISLQRAVDDLSLTDKEPAA